MDKLVLSATVVQGEEGYLAAIENLDLAGRGSTSREAQDDLVDKFMAWVQSQDGGGSLEKTLSDAGFAGVEEETELELQFAE